MKAVKIRLSADSGVLNRKNLLKCIEQISLLGTDLVLSESCFLELVALKWFDICSCDVEISSELLTMKNHSDWFGEGLVRSMASLASALKFRLVATGIESDHQLQWFRSAGCHYAQGDFLCPQITADELHRIACISSNDSPHPLLDLSETCGERSTLSVTSGTS